MNLDCESRIQDIGRQLFAAVNQRRPIPMSKAWIDDMGMALTMRDEQLKIQLFRFVDALPGLSTPQIIADHLREYLAPVAERLPAGLGHLLTWLTQGTMRCHVVAWAARIGVQQLAHRFIAGSDMANTIAAVNRLRKQRLAFTVDLLGEAVVSAREADDYRQAYVELITGLSAASSHWEHDALIDANHCGLIPSVNVSLKLSALVNHFDPADVLGTTRAVRKRLDPLLRLAREKGVFINVDMEQNAFRPLTIDIFSQVVSEAEFRDWPHIGIAIQAYLRDSINDLQHLHRVAEQRGTPLWIRLVKGAYHDYERVIAQQQSWPVPVFTDKAATDANYELLSDYLLDRYDVLRPAFASHNVRSIAHVLAGVERRGMPAAAIEFQMLYGMADSLKVALVNSNQRVRVYAPYGELLPGMAYLVRRLLENTSNQSFVRVGFLEHHDQGKLLMRPQPQAEDMRAYAAPKAFANEPLLDFSIAANREAGDKALTLLRTRLPLSCPAIINGVAINTDAKIVSVNPSNISEVIANCGQADATMTHAAIAAATAALPAWRIRPVPERAELLERLADELVRQRFDLSALIVCEAGKNVPEADADVVEAIDFCRYYAHEMRRLSAPQIHDLLGEHNRTIYDARGVTAVIAPWNFPLAILCGMAVAAAVAGNTVIMKPAEQTPAIAAALMSAITKVGFPSGVFNYLPGIGEVVGPILVEHPAVSLIAFTGSLAVGQAIHRQAAACNSDEIKRVICEMGGKNAIIIDSDADLDEAVTGVLMSAFGFQGQKCSACSRAIVLEAIYDQFVERLIDATRCLTVGPADIPSSNIGPVIDLEARDRIVARIEETKKVAQVGYAGVVPEALDKQGCYVAPHIFTQVDPQSSLAQEEVFGPVLAIIRVKNIDEALTVANGTRFALTGGCYSRSPSTLARVSQEFRVGNLYLNRKITGALVNAQPFGGFKLSGIGSKAGGPDYLLQFMVPRCITENTLRHGFTPDL